MKKHRKRAIIMAYKVIILWIREQHSLILEMCIIRLLLKAKFSVLIFNRRFLCLILI